MRCITDEHRTADQERTLVFWPSSSTEEFFVSTAPESLLSIPELPQALIDHEHAWRTDSYFLRAAQLGVTQALSALEQDFEHTLAEFYLGEIRTHFTMHISADAAHSGGYQDPIETMAGHFIGTLAKQADKELDRSTIERQTWLSENLQFIPWAAESPSTRYWLWCSPPGEKVDGYHGSAYRRTHNPHVPEKNHSFLYLKWVEPQPDGSLVVHAEQLRGWPSIGQLVALHNSLQPNADKHLTLRQNRLDLRIIENCIPLERPHSSPPTVIAEILGKLQATQQTQAWGTNPRDLPRFSQPAFLDQAKKMWLKFLRPRMEVLLHQVPREVSAQNSFWHGRQYANLLVEANLVHDYTFRSLLKWVIDANTNPNFQPEDIFRRLAARVVQQTRLGKSPEIEIDKLIKMHALHTQATLEPTSVSQTQKKRLQLDLGGHLSFASDRVASFAQCISLSPLNMAFTQTATGFSAQGSLSGIAGAELFSRVPFHQAQEYAKNHNCRLITLANQTWLVPENYFDNNGRCYEKDGRVYGPCDIPLDEDPLCQRVLSEEGSPDALAKKSTRHHPIQSNPTETQSRNFMPLTEFIATLIPG